MNDKLRVKENIKNTYLNPIYLGTAQKETSYGEKASRQSVYTIEDNMFRLCYCFVPENNLIIACGAADLVYKKNELSFLVGLCDIMLNQNIKMYKRKP